MEETERWEIIDEDETQYHVKQTFDARDYTSWMDKEQFKTYGDVSGLLTIMPVSDTIDTKWGLISVNVYEDGYGDEIVKMYMGQEDGIMYKGEVTEKIEGGLTGTISIILMDIGVSTQ